MIKLSPLTAFVHVPKTAGSTVNHYLTESGKQGQAHIEALFAQPEKQIERQIANYDWVSGHVPYPKMRDTLAHTTCRPIKFFTAIREPQKQVMSHFNWLIEIYKKGGAFYENHPPRAKMVSESIRASDTSNPKSVVKQIEQASALFLNFQTRLVLGPGHVSVFREDLEQRLRVYEMIATEKSLPELIKRASGMPYNNNQRKNVSPYHFPQEVFQDKYVVDFLIEYNASDYALYEYVQSKGL